VSIVWPVSLDFYRQEHFWFSFLCSGSVILFLTSLPLIPPWPVTPLINQPGRPRLPQGAHIDPELSADAQSTWVTEHQNSHPQIIHDIWPPSSCADHATPSIHKSWHYFSNKRRSLGRHSLLEDQSHGVFFFKPLIDKSWSKVHTQMQLYRL
jgi:hypothetical protein